MARAWWLPFLTLAACYNPDIPDGMLHCGSEQQCPSGLTCVNDVCWHNSVAATLDLSVPDMMTPGPYGNGSLGALDLTGKIGILELDTETGAITLIVGGIDAGAGSDGGTGVTMMPIVAPQSESGMFAQQQSVAGSPKVAVWSFTDLNIPHGISLRPSLDSASIAALASTGDMVFEGNATWTGFGALGGRPGKNGGLPGSPGAPAVGGGSDGSGGGGGGYAMAGTKGSGSGGGAGGEMYGDASVTTVYTGAGGGGGGGAAGGVGGNGGGAFCLLAHHLTFGGTIDVSGVDGVGGDPAATTAAGGGGGGAGGSIVLSSDSVALESGNSLTAKGGHGGTASNGGQDGGNASPGRVLLATGMLVGTPNAQPAANVAAGALTTFPQ